MEKLLKIISATALFIGLIAGVFSIWSCNESPTAPVGSSWAMVQLDTNYSINSIVWTGTTFVAVGGDDSGGPTNGFILTSTNGTNWTETSQEDNINNIAFVNNVLFDNGFSVTSPSMTSTNGTNLKIIGSVGYPVTWNGSEYIAYGDQYFMTSPDGLNWNQGELEVEADLYSMASNGSITVGVGGNFINDTENMGSIATTTNGSNWNYNMIDTVKTISSVVWTGKEFLAIGRQSSPGTIGFPVVFTSTDGITWSSKKLSAPGNPYGLIWDGIRFSALELVDTLPDPYLVGLLTSSDGSNWTSKPFTNNFIRNIASSGTEIVGVSQNGIVMVSQ